MAYEISIEDMSEEQRFTVYDNSPSLSIGGLDPLDIILELEQLAHDSGFPDIHTFIEYHSNLHNH